MKQSNMEKIKYAFKNAQSNMQLNSQCRIYNEEMVETVNNYKEQVEKWDNEPYVSENAFTHATQNLWYSHYLNKKRLKRLGVETKCSKMSRTDYPPAENQRFSIYYSHDGKNLICKILDKLRYKRIFYKNGKSIWKDGSDSKECEYYIIRSKSVNGKCICPNCGHEDIIENLLDGCDYCHTKFHIEDFDSKVSSVYMPNSNTRSRDNNKFKKINSVLFIIFVFALFPFIVNSQFTFGLNFFGFPLMATILIFLSVFILIAGKHSAKKGPGRNYESVEKLRETDPMFSEEYFIGNLTNKLESIHYAESMEEINSFTYCDLSNIIRNYANVLSSRLMECVVMNYNKDGDFHVLEVNVVMKLAEISGDAVWEREEKIRLRLAKNADVKTNAVNDVIVYTCQSCGASVSLLKGGKCSYCGSSMDMIRYDWVVVSYEANQMDS